jgi:hypothetical protein
LSQAWVSAAVARRSPRALGVILKQRQTEANSPNEATPYEMGCQ